METDQTVTADAVAAIFVAANWQPSTKDGWKGSFTWSDGVVVGGIDPWGTMRATSNAGFGMTLEEAAAWLVEHARQRAPVVLTTEATLDPLASLPEEQQSQGHEGDGETGAEAEESNADGVGLDLGRDELDEASGGDDLSVRLPAGLGDLVAGSAEGLADAGGEDADDLGAEPDLIDADFTEDPLLEFGGEVLEEHPEQHGSGAFIFGDNLEQQRTAAIGIVVRISRGKQADIRALMGDQDFAELQGYVLRDTIDGVYRGPPATYATFVELSRHQSAINRVKSAEADKVAFLEAATRPDLEAFNPDADWP